MRCIFQVPPPGCTTCRRGGRSSWSSRFLGGPSLYLRFTGLNGPWNTGYMVQGKEWPNGSSHMLIRMFNVSLDLTRSNSRSVILLLLRRWGSGVSEGKPFLIDGFLCSVCGRGSAWIERGSSDRFLGENPWSRVRILPAAPTISVFIITPDTRESMLS
jgi:hypothetical protein